MNDCRQFACIEITLNISKFSVSISTSNREMDVWKGFIINKCDFSDL